MSVQSSCMVQTGRQTFSVVLLLTVFANVSARLLSYCTAGPSRCSASMSAIAERVACNDVQRRATTSQQRATTTDTEQREEHVLDRPILTQGGPRTCCKTFMASWGGILPAVMSSSSASVSATPILVPVAVTGGSGELLKRTTSRGRTRSRRSTSGRARDGRWQTSGKCRRAPTAERTTTMGQLDAGVR